MALRDFPHIVGKPCFIEQDKHLVDVVRVLALRCSDGIEGGVRQRQSAFADGILRARLDDARIKNREFLDIGGHSFIPSQNIIFSAEFLR